MNDNQNNAAFVKGRTSSRVLAPPGGKSSICLGTAAAAEPSSGSAKTTTARRQQEQEEKMPSSAAAAKAAIAAAARAKVQETHFRLGDYKPPTPCSPQPQITKLKKYSCDTLKAMKGACNLIFVVLQSFLFFPLCLCVCVCFSLSFLLTSYVSFGTCQWLPHLLHKHSTAAEEDAENGGGKNKAKQSTVQKTAAAAVAKPVSSNSFASGSNPNGPQTMTGRLTSRVTQPPGGHTSWSLG